jgi:phosphoribosyl-ATP pyrophosphohydrolase
MSEVAAAAGASVAAENMSLSEVRFGPDGLVPAIVQDAADGRVLMLAWMDAEALAATVETGDVHFHSRSRDQLWRKGETSGNVLRLIDLAVDCDGDAVLVTADPAGPTCHRGTPSCFDPPDPPAEAAAATATAPAAAGATAAASAPAADIAPATATATAPAAAEPHRAPVGSHTRAAEHPAQGFDWLETLWSTIASRAETRPSGSYTASLLEGGVDAVGRKVTEEATELLLAAKDDAAASTDETRTALTGEAADLLYHALVLLAERSVPPSDVLATLRSRHAE